MTGVIMKVLFLIKKSGKGAKTPAWLSRALLNKLQWKKDAYRTLKKGLTTWVEYKN